MTASGWNDNMTAGKWNDYNNMIAGGRNYNMSTCE